MYLKKIKLTTTFLLGLAGLQAQEAIPASGGNASGTGGSASYSIGQVSYTTISGTSGTVAQGVQQPYEISTVTGIDETKNINLTCAAYPNPTTDQLILKVENNNNAVLSYQLLDNTGKLIESENLNGNEAIIIMRELIPATYLLKITQSNKIIKTFKIIKN